ncbi:MAG: hypothetical protein ACYDHT_05810 [Solirubrobacteraceae bacterium]
MISSEVQRTLVKSPPELWAEISDPESLARHLGEFGEIRITRVEPEQRVEWQSGDTSGSVVIKPSGWGTKVMLTVTRELAEQPTGAGVEVESQAEPQGESEPQTVAIPGSESESEAESENLPEPEATTEPEAEPQPTTAPQREDELDEDELEPDADDALAARAPTDFAQSAPLPEPRRGFFARLFGRRRRTPVAAPTPSDLTTDEPFEDGVDDEVADASAPAPYNALAVWAAQIDSDAHAVEEIDDEAHEYAAQAFTQPQPARDESSHAQSDPSPGADCSDAENEAGADAVEGGDAAEGISAEIRAAEEVAAEEVTAVLTGVLDRLGAAHHRPFSRA